MEATGQTLTDPPFEDPTLLELLRACMRNPFRVKGDTVRSHLAQIAELIEYGLITTYDPTIGKRDGSLYLTQEGAEIVWLNQPQS